MDKNALMVGALVAIVFGIVACFFGYRLFRIIYAILGFIAGALLGVALASSLALAPGQETIIRLIMGLVGGLIGAALAWFLYLVGIFLSGAGIGASVGAAIALSIRAEPTVQTILMVVLAIVVGIIAVVLQKLFIILATAFGGAQLIVSGGSQLLDPGAPSIMFNPLALLQPVTGEALPALYMLMLVSWLVIGVLGVLVQYRVTSGMNRSSVRPTTGVSSGVQST